MIKEKQMTLFKKLIALVAVSFALGATAATPDATEAPDVLVKRISLEVIQAAKTDKEIQAGNQRRVMDLVETKILPYVDTARMTMLATGRYWRDATPEQKQRLTDEFRKLLVFTYSGALSQVKDQTVEFKPMRSLPTDTDVEVRSQVNVSRGEPTTLNYRVAKTATGWKIYDINVLGAWLIETYKNSFSSEIRKSGIDGLINVLSEKNKKLADKPEQTAAK
ncbi:MAG: phospholipid transport system substrate-binding protein [Janthinobacterium sp.]